MKTKITEMFSWRRAFALLALISLIGLSRSSVIAQTITEGFSSEQTLQRGMIVKLKSDDPTKIEAVSLETANETHGIVIGPSEAPLTLSAEGQSYYVATVGTFDVLASTQQGPIKRGDYIAISAIDGLGMSASQDDQTVVGIALDDFDGSSDVVSTPILKRADGTETELAVGFVSVDITVSRNPNFQIPEPDVPETLQRITQSIAGQQISPFRAYVSVVVFIATSVTAGTILYGGTRSAMISVGRNPLSKKTITSSMIKVVVVGLIVFISGLFGVYLILRL